MVEVSLVCTRYLTLSRRTQLPPKAPVYIQYFAYSVSERRPTERQSKERFKKSCVHLREYQ
jgi:hypothetical protein